MCVNVIYIQVELSKDLAQWIWQDNMQFLQYRIRTSLSTYFGFMWQMCGYIPTKQPKEDPDQVCSTAKSVYSQNCKVWTSIVWKTSKFRRFLI